MVKQASKSRRGKGKARAKKASRFTARTADKFVLYQMAVQAPELDTAFMARHFEKHVGRPARSFREDFCGTAGLACHWVKRHQENTAIGVDLDGPTLAWGRAHNVTKLLDDEQRQRLTLVQADVNDVRRPRVDIVCALNFSYYIFKTRDALRTYFANCRKSLVDDGVLFLDLWGGSDAQAEMRDRRAIGGATYIWDQFKFDPLSADSTCKIHFEFPDGTKLKDAFVYEWRMWTAKELTELLEEAGFRKWHFLWEGTTKKGTGNGVYREVKRGEADRSWIAYLVARP